MGAEAKIRFTLSGLLIKSTIDIVYKNTIYDQTKLSGTLAMKKQTECQLQANLLNAVKKTH